MTPEEVHYTLRKILAYSTTAGECWYEFGREWLKLHDQKAHKVMGIKRFRDFVKEYTIYDVSWVYALMDVAKTFGHLIEDPTTGYLIGDSTTAPLDITRLREALPYALTPETASEWLTRAKTLPLVGWRDELRVARGQKPSDECDHPETETHERCAICNKWLSWKKGDKI